MIRRPAGLFDLPASENPPTPETTAPVAEPTGSAKVIADSVDALASLREAVQKLGETLEAKMATTIDGINQRLDKLQRRLDEATPDKGMTEPVPEKMDPPADAPAEGTNDTKLGEAQAPT